MSRVAVVTGANKGIGLGLVTALLRRFDGVVYLTSRDEARGRDAVRRLAEQGLHPRFHQLDVANEASVIAFRDHIRSEHGGLDVLINNAGVAATLEQDLTYEGAKYVVDINFFGVVHMQRHVFPLVRDNGRIVNVSSDCGHLSNLRNKHWIEVLSNRNITEEDVFSFVEWYLESRRTGTYNPEDFADNAVFASYRVSKVALSALTIVQQRALAARGVCVNSVHPGLVRTDMTNGVGFLSAEQAAATPLHLALDAPDSLRGAYVWHDGTVLDWYDYKADYYFKSKTLTPDD